ncbi:superoxide dismutase family protein [Streptomyces griseoviridis]|uniref:Superoxide dismutase family protein n=1 Tax=Streptomyces hintoniae TaxID=3075521 RepID=A0ABU2UDP0_9ACTN|nr:MULTISPECIES: superoxide dismutase family protein [unclassified Streptomyces]MDH6701845.1 Cu-Zn family superoxide dismutase [Streptomyces sp. MAA16]MDT0471249.1 superoxide dismutase family protein [Streptomyces sp. DSM 41014]
MVAGICAGAVAAAVLAAGTGGAQGYSVRAEAHFAAPGAAHAKAFTYDRKLVPAGSWIEVRQHTADSGATSVRLRVTGLVPGHAYGVHVHQKPCAADPAAAGGHYQHEPSTDPAAANPDNEVWLDFTARGDGAGSAVARHSWDFRPGEASSVVIHDMPGTKGARVACLTVPFGPRDGRS